MPLPCSKFEGGVVGWIPCSGSVVWLARPQAVLCDQTGPQTRLCDQVRHWLRFTVGKAISQTLPLSRGQGYFSCILQWGRDGDCALLSRRVVVRLPGQVRPQAMLCRWAGHWLGSLPGQVSRLCSANRQVLRLGFKAARVTVQPPWLCMIRG